MATRVRLGLTGNAARPLRLQLTVAGQEEAGQAAQPQAGSAAVPRETGSGTGGSRAPPAAREAGPAASAGQERQAQAQARAQEQAQEQAQAQAPEREAGPAARQAAPPLPPPRQQLSGRRALLVAARPSPLVLDTARVLLASGCSVTIAVRHAEDGRLAVRRLLKEQKQQAPEAPGVTSCEAPLDLRSLPSVAAFAAAFSAMAGPLDLLVLESTELLASGSARRWYTTEGVAGTAQLGFLGPAVLMHLLKQRLAADSTALLLTASPVLRQARLDDVGRMLHTWAGASMAETQAALACYMRELAQHLQGEGVTAAAAAVDVGLLREAPLEGSLLRKVPPLRQLLHLLLPPARDAAELVADVAAFQLLGSAVGSAPWTSRSSGPAPAGPAQEPAGPEPGAAKGRTDQAAAAFEHGRAANATAPAAQAAQAATEAGAAAGDRREEPHQGKSPAGDAQAPSGQRPAFSYCSRGLLASPLVVGVDLAGRSSRVLRALHAATTPAFELAAGSLLAAALAADWAFRAWLARPAGSLTAGLPGRAGSLLAQLQRLAPGVLSVPAGAPPHFVAVAPPSAVSDASCGSELWRLVDEAAALAQRSAGEGG